MSTHTPGPWTSIVPPSSLLTTRWVRAETGESIALVGYRDFTAGTHADVANARLIAAAPDLLAALQVVADAIKRWDCGANDVTLADVLIATPAEEAIYAAIARATGGQP